ncbi:uncharacterized protein LOC132205830 isoform X2 [Neocloeon triangulifer]|uniref:uncharacterized protein LOC132205830 isoform X2 n=1 Tax=Neocloeon triangulifer TaxID=2078957 RepID=UPI00286F06AA|nr:uncharacterized protein LOC132205830 isoform X2 [Neocloeon triangulifer]
MASPLSQIIDIYDYSLAVKQCSKEVVRAAYNLETRRHNLVPLRELAMRTVVTFMLERFKPAPTLIDRLPKRLKSEVLEEVTNVVSDSHREDLLLDLSTVKQLITSDLQKFNFITVFKKDWDEIWKHLTSSAPNLKSISDSHQKRWHFGRDHHEPKPAEPILQYLIKFVKLIELKLTTFQFSDEDIRKLSKSCTNLKSINLNMSSELTSEGLYYLSSLPLLEKVEFGPHYSFELFPERSANPQKAFEMLPNLKIITDLSMKGEYTRLYIPRNPQRPFNLQKLGYVDGYLEKIPSHLRELKEMRCSNDLALEVYDQLPLLQALDSPTFPKDFATLQLIGSRLVEITSHDSFQGTIDVRQVLRLCPNLEKLHLYASFIMDDQKYCFDPVHLKLKDLKMTQSFDVNIDIPFFWDLLLAPNLHSVCLKRFIFTEPRALLDSADPFLLKLANLDILFGFEWPVDEIKNKMLDLHNEWVLGLIKNCPKLQTLYCSIAAFGSMGFNGIIILSVANVSKFSPMSPTWKVARRCELDEDSE